MLNSLSLPTISQALLEQGHISSDNHQLMTSRRLTDDKKNLHVFEQMAELSLSSLITNKTIDETWLVDWLGAATEISHFHIDPLKTNTSLITEVMPFNFAKKYNILAVDVNGSEITVAGADPFDQQEWRESLIQRQRDKTLKFVLAKPSDLRRYRQEFYNLERSMRGAENTPEAFSGINNFEQLLQLGSSVGANDQHIVSIVDWILQYAFEQRASDIHIEPRRDIGKLRFRIDGVLHHVYEMPANISAAVISRIKILGRLNVAEKRQPQDGRIKTVTPNKVEIELRLSTLPTAFGEKLVMRIFDPEVLVRSFDELGFSKEDLSIWNELTKSPNGIIYVTGPTGSGKTTTLYSTLKKLATDKVNVCTIEDPIEMIDSDFNQVQVQEVKGLDFAQGVKSMLRQDPDIIMIGEIRDLATAEMAIQAALTGHLVLTTLHTNDAPSTITRLLDLGVPGYLISATTVGVVAQRLVRRLCTHCKQEVPMNTELWEELVTPWKAAPPETMSVAQGCLECRETGYSGRVGLYEMMKINTPLKKLISKEADLESLRTQAYKSGLKTLRLRGAQKVASGKSTLDEVLRVTPQVHID